MAIIAPTDLPAVLKVQSDPMKKYVLSKLGFSNVEVEISEDQWETLLRPTGDFISGYFPREQKLAVFYTQPLKSTYPMPSDAYWVQEVSWQPISSNISDIFGAESFLFCVAPDFKVLAKDGSLQPIGDWRKSWLAKTPRGYRRLQIARHDSQRLLPKIRLIYDSGEIEATSNHVIKSNDRWREFLEVRQGDQLSGIKNKIGVQNIEAFEAPDAISVRAVGAGAYYGCTNGDPILIH